MRLFLLPISTRRSIIYGQQIADEISASRSYGERFEARMMQVWTDWEKSDRRLWKGITRSGNKMLAKIPYKEAGLKTIPPLRARQRKSIIAGTAPPIEVLFPKQYMDEGQVLALVKKLALERQSLHVNGFYANLVALPLTVPFALVPIIPNIPFFYVTYRAWAHWRAYRGSKHLELLLERNLLVPRSSAYLHEVYAAAAEDGPDHGDPLIDTQTGSATGGPNLTSGHTRKERILLQPGNGKMIAEFFKAPQLEDNVLFAIQQILKKMSRNEGPYDDEELTSKHRRPAEIGLIFKFLMLFIAACAVAWPVYVIVDTTIGEAWRAAIREATDPRKRPRYAPLRGDGEIRLLVLKAGQADDSIVCVLQHANLHDSPDFEALSYVWGDRLETRRIVCDGKETDIGVNLQEALQHLRLPDRDRVLWADALCINQDDVVERTQQVRQMGSLYSAADRVVIWLGKETPANRGAFGMIAAICTQFPVDRWVSEAREVGYLANVEHWEDWEADFGSFYQSLVPVLPESFKNQSREQLKLDKLLSAPIRTEPIAELLRYPWFRRIWVAQELASAKNAVVMCGKEELPWNVFKGTIDFLWPIIPHKYSSQYSYHLGMPPADTITARENLLTMHLMRSKYHSRTSGHTLLDLVLLTRGFECTDPRDKIFALVSIAKDVKSTDWEVAPDYSRTVEDVYKQFALWSITKRRDLQVLSLTPDPLLPPKLSLPSWIPDLTRANHAEPLPVLSNSPITPDEELWVQRVRARWRRKDVFHADRKSRFSFRTMPRISLSGNNNELHVAGRKVDLIKEVGSVANFAMVPYYNPNMSDNQNALGAHHTSVNAWLSETLMIASEGTGSLPWTTFAKWWPTLSCGMDSSGRQLSWKWRYAFTTAAFGLGFTIPDYGWRTLLPLDGFFEVRRPKVATWRLRNHHEPAIIRWSKFRRFCSTADGRLGLVPGGAAPGDIVCILEGARVPYILRPNAEGSTYKVVGEAYVHGLMHGEGARLQNQLVEEAIFVLH